MYSDHTNVCLVKQREPINNHRNTIQGIKSKLVVAFSKSGLQENLDELTAFNVELSSLCSIDKKPLTVDTTRSGDLRPFIEKARADRMIAETSQAAFDMLGSSCSEHQEHQANLNMLATCAIDDYSITSRIELNLALAGGQMQCEPVWLELKMVFREIKDCNRITGRSDGMSNWTARLKIALADPDALFILRTKERTTGLQNAGILPDQEAPDPIETATTTCGSNGSGQELCSLLRRCCLQQSSKHPVDFKVRSVKWHVSVRPARTDPTARQPPVSLRSLLDTLSQQDRLASLSIPQRVRLAKLLSIGFLRHHSTDWGRPAWQCHRIFFFDVCCDAKNKPLQLPSPHVSALICGLNGTPPTQPSNMPTIAGVKGSRFFHLGLLLIEIAHLKTWEDLKLRLVHGVHEHETKIDEVSQVKRLSKSRLSLLPGQYHDVAERLIEGKFSYGDDLRNVESQAEFYQQIIDPLENLEQDFQRMGFAV